MVSPDTGNTERDDLKGTRAQFGKVASQVSPWDSLCFSNCYHTRNNTFSLSLNARGTCAKSVWSSLMRSICSDRCPYMKHRWMMFLQLFFLICFLFICFFFFCSNQYWYHDAPTIHAILYRLDGSIPTTTLLLVQGRGVDQCGG